ncbi:hypothetical protein ACFFRR_005925 [Megaselia abdita]
MVRCLIVLTFVYLCAGDLFTSQVCFNSLLATEKILIESFENYVVKTEEKLENLNRNIELICKERTKPGDPTQSFLLIKRFLVYWPKIKDVLEDNSAMEDFLIVSKLNFSSLHYLNKSDFDGAALGLARIQDTYNLNIEDLTAGIIGGQKYSSSLSWEDCFHISNTLFNWKLHKTALIWIEETKRKLLLSSNNNNSTLADIYDSFASNYIMLGIADKASEAIQSMNDLQPDRPSIVTRLNELNEITIPEKSYIYSKSYDLYKRTCRDDVSLSKNQQRDLKCRYKTGPAPFLKLAPFKMEEVNKDPSITVYYNAITNNEIKYVINTAKPFLELSGTFGNIDDPRIRVSKSMFLNYLEHSILTVIYKRLNDITGLKMKYTEQFQVAKYDIGGMYEPHVDSFKDSETEGNYPEFGNRIGSAMFYLSDVEMGGSTAFNYLGVNIKPEKGKLVFWENLHSGGAIDFRTKHAGCPIVLGSKWIMNAWTRSLEQTFTRPCKLINDNDVSTIFETWKIFEDVK